MSEPPEWGSINPQEMRVILRDLMTRLAASGPADIYVIGGAAIALFHPNRRVTIDVDGWIRSAHLAEADEVIADLEREYGLRPDWFNGKASGLIPPIAGPDMWHQVDEIDGVVLFRATVKSLLAMKLHAARRKDEEDLAFLLHRCKVTSVEEAEAIYEQFYPGDVMKDKAVERVKFALGL